MQGAVDDRCRLARSQPPYRSFPPSSDPQTILNSAFNAPGEERRIGSAMRAKDRRRAAGRVVNRCAGDAKSDRSQVQQRDRSRLLCMSLLSSDRRAQRDTRFGRQGSVFDSGRGEPPADGCPQRADSSSNVRDGEPPGGEGRKPGISLGRQRTDSVRRSPRAASARNGALRPWPSEPAWRIWTPRNPVR